MSAFARLLGISLAFVLLLAGVATIAQVWLQQQNDAWMAQQNANLEARFAANVRLHGEPRRSWSDEHLTNFGQAIEASLLWPGPGELGESLASSPYAQRLELTDGSLLLLHGPAPGALLMRLQQRTTLALLVFAAFLLCLLIVTQIWWRRPHRAPGGGTAWPWNVEHAAERSGMGSLARLANDRGQNLQQEQEIRRRVEQELTLREKLLDQTQEASARLGRDLHDGIIQTLYATGLNLEAAKRHLNPDHASRTGISTAGKLLNEAIKEIRAYIGQTSRGQQRQKEFAAVIAAAVAQFPVEAQPSVTSEIDPKVIDRLTADAHDELVFIVREAVSNALRHGLARHIAVRLQADDDQAALAVSDDGVGFDPGTDEPKGFGLANLRQRAADLGGQLQCHSAPGTGTRVVITFPLPHEPDPYARTD